MRRMKGVGYPCTDGRLRSRGDVSGRREASKPFGLREDFRVQYSKEFFALQVRFAGAAASLTGLSVERALLDYTNLYIRFGLGRAFDHAHPAWRRYAEGVDRAADLAEWTYRFYLAQAENAWEPSKRGMFGCFSYAMQDAGSVRLHFRNVEPAAVSPLSIERLPSRLRELRSLFAHIRRNHEAAHRVVGTSWLHNLRAYQRCFPHEYAASATVAESRFRNLPLWGQFLDRNGFVRADMADDFIRRLSSVTHARDLARSFPLQALAVEAPIAQFYRFYGLRDERRAT